MKSPIKRILDMRGIKYSWLSQQIGITQQEFDHYEGGRRRPPEGYYDRISEVLDVPADMLRALSPEVESVPA